MGKLKNIFSWSAIIALLMGVVTLYSCADDNDELNDGGKVTAKVTKYLPATSVTEGIELFSEMELVGTNMDGVHTVEVCGHSATLTHVSSTKITFPVPNGRWDAATVVECDYPGVRYATDIKAYDSTGKLLFTDDIVVDVPTTEPWGTADVEVAWIGCLVTIDGYNLDTATSVKLSSDDFTSEIEVSADDFFEVAAKELKFYIPTSTEFKAGLNEGITLSLTSATGDEDFVVAEDFTVATPVIDMVSLPTSGKANDLLCISGEYMHLVEQIAFGEQYKNEDGDMVYKYACTIKTRSEEAVYFTIASSDSYMADYNVTEDLSIFVGTRAFDRQQMTIVDDFALDTTPANPTISGINKTTGTVGTKVTLSGSNLYVAKALYVGTELVASVSDFSTFTNEIEFYIPGSAQYTAGSNEVAISLTYGADDKKVVLSDFFYVNLPSVEAGAAAAGTFDTEYTIAGTALDNISKIMFGDVECEIVEQSAYSLKYVIPYLDDYGVAAVDDVVTANLVAYYGGSDDAVEGDSTSDPVVPAVPATVPEQEITLIENFALNVTDPVMVVTAISANAGTVGTEVTLTGEYFELADKIKLVNEVGVDAYIFPLTVAEDFSTIKFFIPDTSNYDTSTIDGEEALTITLTSVGGVDATFAEEVSNIFTVSLPTITTSALTEVDYDTEYTLAGFNLDMIDAITFGDFACTINSASETELKFTIPYDENNYGGTPVANEVSATLRFAYGEFDPQTTIDWAATIDVTVPAPVVSAVSFDTAKLSSGSVVTLEGEYLDFVTSLSVGSYDVAASALTIAADEISFAITSDMLMTIGAANNDITIDYQIGDAPAVENAATGKSLQAVIPVITTTGSIAATCAVPFEIEGANLDLISSATYSYFEASEMVVIPCDIAMDGEKLTVAIPYDESFATSGSLNFKFGYDSEDYSVSHETLPVELTITKPTLMVTYMTALDPADPAGVTLPDDKKFMTQAYVGGLIEFGGFGLDLITGVKLGEKFATIVSQSATAMTVQVASDYEFALTENGDAEGGKGVTLFENNQTEEGTNLDKTEFLLKVYPFFHYTDITLNGRNSGEGTVFFNLETGKYVPATEFAAMEPEVSQGKASTDYNSVDPYVFYNPTSGSASFYSPQNAINALYNVKADGDSITGGVKVAGTPVVKYKILNVDDASYKELSDAVLAKSFVGQQSGKKGSTSSPKFGNSAKDALAPVTVDVTTGGPVAAMTYFRGDAYKNGYIVFKSTTSELPASGAYYQDGGHKEAVTVDIFWPAQPLR